MNHPEREATSKHRAQHAQRLDWSEQLKPRGCEVTQAGSKGFWFLRQGKAAAEFMAWPETVATDTRQYGRVDR